MKKTALLAFSAAIVCTVAAWASAPKAPANPANSSGNDKSPNGPPDKFTLCHNDKNPHTLTLPEPAYNAHLRNHPGDYPGACR